MVTVRFAPSPTGYLHLGNARTALFNFLFAEHEKGRFILRIEDTDKERSRPEFEADIINQLQWLGLTWHAFCRQSERKDIYQQLLTQLINEKKAYRCFCPKEDLQTQRQEQMSRGEAPRYSGKCRSLNEGEIATSLAAKRPYVIRLVVPPRILKIRDLIREEVSFDLGLLGDFVVAKSETEPLFLFATPVDDHLMGVTHIIRGEDHLSNTPKQILVFEALGWKHPLFAHVPIILNEKLAKLSKRFDAASVREYKELGYLPEALVNFLLLLGWHPSSDREIFSLKEAVHHFSLERVQKKGAVFNRKKLNWLNRYYLQRKSPAEILSLGRHIFSAWFIPEPPGADEPEAYRVVSTGTRIERTTMEQIIVLGKERADTLNDIAPSIRFFFEMPEYQTELLRWKETSLKKIKETLGKVAETLGNISEESFRSETIKNELECLGESLSDRGVVFWPFRAALTGLPASPPPFEIAAILGKRETLQRVEGALRKIENSYKQ